MFPTYDDLTARMDVMCTLRDLLPTWKLPPPPIPTWPSRPAHSALFTGPCNAQIHQPEQFLSRPGIFFSPKNRPYFGCGIYIYIVDAVKKTRRNITQFLS